MNTTRLGLAAVGLALALTACSSSTPDPAKPDAKPAAAPAAAAIAHKAGCTSVEQDDAELYVREQASCTTPSGEITVRTFADKGARDSWLKAAAEFGLSPSVVGDRWQVETEAQDTAKRLAATLGGTVY